MSLRPVALTIGVLVPLAFASCNLLVPMAFVGEHKKRITPEFDKLANSRVAVLVWTDPSTLFDYPYVRLELSAYVAEKLSTELTQRRVRVDVVPPREVEDLLQKRLETQIDPQKVGEAFHVDYVVYVEVLKFQVRDPEQPQFLRGEIHASVVVHDVRADPDQLGRYELTPVQCVYPEGAPILMTATNSPLVREATYRKFAEQVARKFYEHTVAL